MSKKILNTIFIALIPLLNSCTDSKSQSTIITNLRSYGVDISNKKQAILYLPPGQCKGCNSIILDSTFEDIRDDIHVILYTDTQYVRGFKNYILDSKNSFIKIKELQDQNYIIVIDDGKVSSINRFTDTKQFRDFIPKSNH